MRGGGSLSDSCLDLLVLKTTKCLQEEMLVLFPGSRRRGGAESLINTAVTRVKPPETCAAFRVPPPRVYATARPWVGERRLALT